MIVGDLKPLAEIITTVSAFRRVHILGCGACVSVCLSGGDREAQQLAMELSRPGHFENDPPAFTVSTIERQCENDMLTSFLEIPKKTDAILSLACGCGVQTVADVYEPLPVIPALNTTFMGAADKPGVWNEKCRGCGDCMLEFTGGICPVSRCAKSLYNGPCGGSQNGACEIAKDMPCAWALIFYRLKKQDKLDNLDRLQAPRDWRTGPGKGTRNRTRTGIGGSASPA
jgi:ferredoxin